MRVNHTSSLALCAGLLFVLVCVVAPCDAAPPALAVGSSAAPAPDTSAPVFRLFIDLQDPTSRLAWQRYRAAVINTPVLLRAHPLPLARHPRARAAAHAAMAARHMGKEAAFMDALLLRKGLSDVDFAAAAAEAKLAAHAFKVARTGARVRAQVERERRAAIAFGVRATPSALLLGRGASGLPTPGALRSAIRSALKRWRRCQAEAVLDCEGATVGADGAAVHAALTQLRSAGHIARPSVFAQGHLGARWRLTLPKIPWVLPGSPNVIAVWFVDPAASIASQERAALRAAAAAGKVRLVVIPVASRHSPLEAALAVHGALAALSADAREAALRRFLVHGGGRHLTAALGMSATALRSATGKPAATVGLQAALDLAQRVDGVPGAVFLNGRRWHPGADKSGAPSVSFTSAIAQAQTEATALGGMLASERYARLVAAGRQRSPAEADLAPGATRQQLAPLVALGSTRASASGLDAWLLVDFRRMGARAAFFALKFLQRAPQSRLRLHIASQVPSPKGVGANLALVIAAKHGKGLACAQRLFNLRDPNSLRALKKLFKKIGLKPALLTRGARDPAIRAAVARIGAAVGRHTRATRLFLGPRRYIGPIDENRISAAVSFLSQSSGRAP